MLKKIVFFGLILISGAAQAGNTLVFNGTLKYRKQCADTGGMFATDLGCKNLAINSDRSCQVALTFQNEELIKASVKVSEITLNKEAGTLALSARLKKPYLYKDNFVAYMSKLNSSSSLELKVSVDTGHAQDFIVYTKHVTKKDGSRTFNEYRCGNLRLAR